MTRELSDKEQKEFYQWWKTEGYNFVMIECPSHTGAAKDAYAAALDSPSVRELRGTAKVLRSRLELFSPHEPALAATAHLVKE